MIWNSKLASWAKNSTYKGEAVGLGHKEGADYVMVTRGIGTGGAINPTKGTRGEVCNE